MSSTPENLKSRVVRAGAWATAYSIAGIVLRLGSSLILTRLLVPEVFGLVSLASALLTIVNLFSDIGLGPCVIYHKHGEERGFLDTVRSMTAIRGVLIAVVATLVALALKIGVAFGLFAAQSAYNHPDLPAVLVMTALTSVILGFKSPKMFVCERRLDLKTLLSVELVANIVGTAATVCLTWLWRSVWAIVVGGYATAMVSVVLSHYWVPGGRGRFGWDKGLRARNHPLRPLGADVVDGARPRNERRSPAAGNLAGAHPAWVLFIGPEHRRRPQFDCGPPV